MADYVFVDGPLAGQTSSLVTADLGHAIFVEVADYAVGPTEPGHTYVVDTLPSLAGAGHLRYVSSAVPEG